MRKRLYAEVLYGALLTKPFNRFLFIARSPLSLSHGCRFLIAASFRIIEKCTKSTLAYRDLEGSTRLVDVIKTLLTYVSGGSNRYFIRDETTKAYFAIPVPKVIDKDAIKVSSLKSLLQILTPSPIINILRKNKGTR